MANVEGFGFDSHWTSWFSFDYYGRSFIAPTVFLSALSSTVSLAASLLHPVHDESSSSRDTKTVLSQRLREDAFALEKSLLVAVAVDLDLHTKSTRTTAISVAWGRRPTGGQDVSVVPEVHIERVGSTAVGSV